METVADSEGTQVEIEGTNVTADIVISRGNDGCHVVQIYGWSSHDPGKGNTNRALAKLKADYPGIITVHDAGLRGTQSYAYWQRQLAADRIDFVYDDNGDDIDA